ncbi:MAG: hypothetical protein HY815_23035 [Candidatus Riflebacteria bacterium]|nr:hypothetical protein [Candidatus Riflebacteria bacterium]
MRPRLAEEGLFRAIAGVAAALVLLVALCWVLFLSRTRAALKARGLEGQYQEQVKLLKLQQSSELRELADQAKARSLKRATLFLRVMDMFKAETKETFFRTFGEAVLKGFLAKQCAFYLFDRAANALYPKVYESPSAHGEDSMPALGRVKEVATPAVQRIRVTPGDPNLVGWTAKERIPITKDQLATDVTKRHLKADHPLKTTVCVPVSTQDPVTREQKFIGVIALGELEEATWTETDSSLLTAVANLTGVAFAKTDLLELQAAELASTKELSIKEREQRKQMRAVLDRVVAPELADQLLARPDTLDFQGELVEASVFFSDVREFTTYSEKRSPREVVAILNEYLSAMTDVILEFGGTLDKFVGDEIVAFWGPLTKSTDHAERAIRAALKMRETLRGLQDKWLREKKEPLHMGMGISTGQVLFGCIGSAKKVDFTVMGDTVNLGARLQTLTRKFPYDLIISEATYGKVSRLVQAEAIGEVQVKGKTEPVPVYGVKSLTPG